MLMNWLRDEEGQAMVEYGLIIALIAIAVIVALGLLGGRIRDLFEDVDSTISSAANAAGGGNGGGGNGGDNNVT